MCVDALGEVQVENRIKRLDEERLKDSDRGDKVANKLMA